MKTRLPVVMLALLASLAAQETTQKRLITEKDLFDFVWVANPQLSPNGASVAFTRVNCDEKRTGYETSIWIAATNGKEAPLRMTNGKHDAQPRWSPDGKQLVFVRGGDKDETGKPKPGQLALLSLGGGEARVITDLPKGASNPVWSPDGKRIAFTSSTTQEDIQKVQRKKKAGDGQAESEHESDVHVISRAVYRSNDEGYLDPKRHSHIWVLEAPTDSDELPAPMQLTSGNFDDEQLLWSHDGARIYFVTQRIEEPYYELPSADIYSASAAGGIAEKLVTIPMGIRDLVLSPDGRRLAFHGSAAEPIRSYSQPDLWVMDVGVGAKPQNLTADYDFDMGDSVFGDNAAPRGGSGRKLYWSPDGRWLFDIVSKQGRTFLVHVDAQSRKVTEITRGDEAVLDFSVSADANAVVALVSSPVMIGDLFAIFERRDANSHQRFQSEAVVATQSDCAGGSQLHELRRKAHSGLDPETARLRHAEEVPSHSQHSRRSACCLRLGLRSRISMDGCEGLRCPVRQSTRLHQLRTGIWECHSVPLPRGRLPRSDGWSRRSPEAWLRR